MKDFCWILATEARKIRAGSPHEKETVQVGTDRLAYGWGFVEYFGSILAAVGADIRIVLSAASFHI